MKCLQDVSLVAARARMQFLEGFEGYFGEPESEITFQQFTLTKEHNDRFFTILSHWPDFKGK